jgi:dTDP-4-dehydrorhamnose reductase
VKILVTGKTGQVGWRLAQVLPAVGETIATARDALDLTKPDTIRAVIREMRPDVIVNAAGLTQVDSVESEKATAHAVNAVAPGIIAEEAKRLGALLVHYSSVYVFDGRKATAYTESDAPNPVNEYGRSKLLGEEAVTAVGGHHLILRASWVYDVRARNFLLTMLRLAATRDELQVVDDQIGSPTWAGSIAQATCELLRRIDRLTAAPGIYNLSALGRVSRYDLTARIVEATAALRPGRPAPRLTAIKTPDFPLPAIRPLNSSLDNTKLLETFDIPLATWQDQLSACLAELRPQAVCN